MIDTADRVRVVSTGEFWTVACVHGAVVHLCWPGHRTLRLDDVELVREATPEQRHQLLRTLASAEARGHRNTCARERLATSGGPSE